MKKVFDMAIVGLVFAVKFFKLLPSFDPYWYVIPVLPVRTFWNTDSDGCLHQTSAIGSVAFLIATRPQDLQSKILTQR